MEKYVYICMCHGNIVYIVAPRFQPGNKAIGACMVNTQLTNDSWYSVKLIRIYAEGSFLLLCFFKQLVMVGKLRVNL